MSTTGSNENSLHKPSLFWLAILLTLAGFWLSPYPPLVDFAQHSAQIVTLQEYWSGNPEFTATFELNWFAPYTATYLVYYVLAMVLPVQLAGKILISACVIAIPLLTRQMLREVNSDTCWAWLVIPGSLSAAFYWGLMPFMLATVFGLFLLVLSIRFGRNPTLVGGIGIAACTVTLFFFHVLALGFIALIALVMLAAMHIREPKKIILCWLPYTAGLPLIVLWIFSALNRDSDQLAAVWFGAYSDRIYAVVTQIVGQGGGYQAVYMVPLSLIILGLPFLFGARFSKEPWRWLPFVIALLIVAALPAKAFGAILIYIRLSVFLLPLLLFALEFPKELKPVNAYAVAIVVVFCAFLNINRFSDFDKETLGFSRMMSLMEERSNVMYLPIQAWSSVTKLPSHFHTAMWYQVEKRGIVDFNFAYFYPSLVRFRPGQHEWIEDDALVWNPTYYDWDRNNGEHYDYFVVNAYEDPTELIFKQNQDQVELVENLHWWWLYKRVDAPATENATGAIHPEGAASLVSEVTPR
ncbi:MAG: hypothetical protein ACR2QG_04350 [Gammaproteobacteria bacterium]